MPKTLWSSLRLCKFGLANTPSLALFCARDPPAPPWIRSSIKSSAHCKKEIEIAVKTGNPDVIFHTNSAYPSKVDEINLNYIKHLRQKYPTKQIGYSGHEFGLVTTFATVPLGVTWVERHITLDRTMWGSDQMASVEPHGLIKLVKGIRDIEKALGPEEQNERILFESELKKRKSLRGN